MPKAAPPATEKKPRGRPPKAAASAPAPAKAPKPRGRKPKVEKVAVKPEPAKASPKKSAYQRKSNRLPETVGTSELASILGIVDRRVAQLVTAGVLVKEGRGEFVLSKTIQGYVAYIKDAAEMKAKESSKRSALTDKRAAQIERQMARDDRILITMEEAISAVDELTGAFIDALSSLPARATKDREERVRLENLCNDIRSDLASRASNVKAEGSLRPSGGAFEAVGEEDA